MLKQPEDAFVVEVKFTSFVVASNLSTFCMKCPAKIARLPFMAHLRSKSQRWPQRGAADAEAT